MITCTIALLSALSILEPTASDCYSGCGLCHPDYEPADDYEHLMFGLKKEISTFRINENDFPNLVVKYPSSFDDNIKTNLRYEVCCAIDHTFLHIQNEINRTLFRKRHPNNDDPEISSRSKADLERLNLDATRIGDIEAYKSLRFMFEFIRDTNFIDISKPAFEGPEDRILFFTIIDTWGCGNLRRNVKYLWVDPDDKK